MSDSERPLINSLVIACLDFCNDNCEGWEIAYFRVEHEWGSTGLEWTWVRDGKAHGGPEGADSDPVMEAAEEVSKAIHASGNKFKVMLVTVQPNNKFNVKFEYKDGNRWEIRMGDGKDGIPRD